MALREEILQFMYFVSVWDALYTLYVTLFTVSFNLPGLSVLG
jgi:hypothetical protein